MEILTCDGKRVMMMKKPKRFWRLLFLVFLLATVVGFVAIYHEVYRSDAEVITSGKKRGFLLHVPKSYRAGQPTPLVISLHGFGEWPGHLMRVSGWNGEADEGWFLGAYPRGSAIPLHRSSSGNRGKARKSAKDVQCISDL